MKLPITKKTILFSSFEPSDSISRKNNGIPTTNQTSRALNKKKRASARLLILLSFDRTFLIFVDFIPLGSLGGIRIIKIRSIRKSITLNAIKPLENPTKAIRAHPRKNPTPFIAFLDPVNLATHLNNISFSFCGARILTLDFALVLVRSLAIPDRA